jgi:hypothetical protein
MRFVASRRDLVILAIGVTVFGGAAAAAAAVCVACLAPALTAG